MKKILVGLLGGLAVLVAIFGAGPAEANNEYVGQTYEKASSNINRWGKAVIVSRVGSYLPTEKCIVTGSRRGNFLDSSGRHQGSTVLLDLNCNEVAALLGHPGNSVTSPQGQRVQQRREAATNISNNYANAVEAGKESAAYCAKNADNCKKICEEARNCSAELLEFLGI